MAMAPNFERNLRQTLTYWEPISADIFGKMAYTLPRQLICRWEDKVELFRDKLGTETISRAKVFLAEDVDLDGYLFLGHSPEEDPTLVEGAHEIRQVTRLPDLRNLKTLYVVLL